MDLSAAPPNVCRPHLPGFGGYVTVVGVDGVDGLLRFETGTVRADDLLRLAGWNG